MRTTYARLSDHGKPSKLALVALMRKILTTLNAMLRNTTPLATAAAICAITTVAENML